MIRKTRIAVAAAALCLAASPAFADDRDDKRERRWVTVPPGHLPPPGECRIWFADRPAGHQPPPGDCRELSRRVPRGAVLVEGG